jgi:hypothetical protein
VTSTWIRGGGGGHAADVMTAAGVAVAAVLLSDAGAVLVGSGGGRGSKRPAGGEEMQPRCIGGAGAAEGGEVGRRDGAGGLQCNLRAPVTLSVVLRAAAAGGAKVGVDSGANASLPWMRSGGGGHAVDLLVC